MDSFINGSSNSYNGLSSLNDKQTLVYNKVLKEKKNVFITGSAGTGKTYLLKVIVNDLKKIYTEPSKIAVTAMTGIAARNINGVTLHSFAGLGLNFNPKVVNAETLNKWKKLKILIVDEISMLNQELFINLYDFIRKYNINIQIIFSGDFFQLPPVKGVCCFINIVWKNMGFYDNTVELTDIVRQSDKEFITVLNEIRVGNISNRSIRYLKKLDIKNKPLPKNTSDIVKLYALNKDVDYENMEKLNKIEYPEVVINHIKHKAYLRDNEISIKNIPDFMIEKMDKEIPVKIKLKKGSRVMLTRNRDKNLVNGSMGTIVKFVKMGDYQLPVVKYDSVDMTDIVQPVTHEVKYKNYTLEREFIPIKLAWSLTIHKSQGLTLDKVYASLHGSFTTGQIYTVLSRIRDPKYLYIDNISILLKSNKACEYSKKYYKKVKKNPNNKLM